MRYEKLGFEIASLSVASDENTLYCVSRKYVKTSRNGNKIYMTLTKTKLPLPPGNFGLPLVGETISFLTDNNFAEKREKKYGKIYKSHIFGNPTIFLAGAEANKFLFSNENK